MIYEHAQGCGVTIRILLRVKRIKNKKQGIEAKWKTKSGSTNMQKYVYTNW